MEKLFSEFKAASAADWKQQIIKDLKGAEFEKLIWHNPNGFDVNPFYTAEDLKESPGSLFAHADWEICERIIVSDDQKANGLALKALTGGASGIIFVVAKKPDFSVLLNDISAEHIELNFELKYKDDGFTADLNSYLKKKSISPEKINGSISFDPINFMVETGEEITVSGNNTSVNASVYQNAGATQSFELACALAHAHEYLIVNTGPGDVKSFRFTIAVGSDFFGEIAKLRALRKLWALIANEYKVSTEIKIHCETSLLNKSSLDENNNMLRTTTEGMSAVIGGCNSLTVNPYNAGYSEVSDFSGRMARNQQLILKGESYLDKVADMGAGSYYIESLTDEIASKAWQEFKRIESKGGFVACLKTGYIQDRISEQAEELIKQFKEEKIVLVGVNKFKNPKEDQEQRIKRKEAKLKTQFPAINTICLSDHLVKQNA